jgi:hypothetical protein
MLGCLGLAPIIHRGKKNVQIEKCHTVAHQIHAVTQHDNKYEFLACKLPLYFIKINDRVKATLGKGGMKKRILFNIRFSSPVLKYDTVRTL